MTTTNEVPRKIVEIGMEAMGETEDNLEFRFIDGPEGKGWYCWDREYSEDGCWFCGDIDDQGNVSPPFKWKE